MVFSIAGYCAGEWVLRTRKRPSSASLLAQIWTERGLSNVSIAYEGEVLDLDSFRRRFVLTPVGVKPRSGHARYRLDRGHWPSLAREQAGAGSRSA